MKQELLKQFESTLYDFWGDEPTKKAIQEAWVDFLDAVKETEPVQASWYKLTTAEKTRLYNKAGI